MRRETPTPPPVFETPICKHITISLQKQKNPSTKKKKKITKKTNEQKDRVPLPICHNSNMKSVFFS